MTSEVLAHIAVLEAEQPAPQKDDGAGQDSPRCLPETIYRAGLLVGARQVIAMLEGELAPLVKRRMIEWLDNVTAWSFDCAPGTYLPPAEFREPHSLPEVAQPPAPRPLPPRPRDPWHDAFASRTGPEAPKPVEYREKVGTGHVREALANLPHTEASERP